MEQLVTHIVEDGVVGANKYSLKQVMQNYYIAADRWAGT